MTSNGGSHTTSSGNVEERLMVCKERYPNKFKLYYLIAHFYIIHKYISILFVCFMLLSVFREVYEKV